MDSESLHHSVVALVERLTEQIDDPHGLGFMSPAIYDTAWVSMVSKTVEGQTVWLFPECFEYILQNQQEDGSWITYASQIDGILNTAASLLSLKRHFDHPHQIAPVNSERIQRATEALQALLDSWDVGTTLHVGFEILVPALLDYLAAERISFAFPGRDKLFEIRQQKLARFRAEYLYLPIKTTALHSLEAFIGSVNFDQVSHHKVNGALMASPSSTAAFLMHASQWDDECEAYLRHAIEFASGRGTGGVPSAFPSTIFEVTWSLSTLLKCGFDLDLTKLDAVQKAQMYLYNALTAENGVVGFTPHVGADADDTAKAILVLHLLQHPFSCDAMLKEFEADHHFRTYPQERDPSFSANCNVLLALLHTPDPSQYAAQIDKSTRFLHAHFTDSKLEVRDKWNLSPYYSWMLMTQAIVRLLQLWNSGQLQSLPSELFTKDLPVLLSDMTFSVLRQGNPNGSWGTRNSKEETAYAVLILTYAAHFELTHESHREIRKAIKAGCSYLLDKGLAGSERLWVEKVTYESEILSQTYVLAALKNAASLPLEEPAPVKVNSTNGPHVEPNGVDWTLVKQNGVHANGIHINDVGHVNGNNGVHLNGERHDEVIHSGESLAVPVSATTNGIHLNEDEHHEHNQTEESDSESGSVGTNGTTKSQYQRQEWTADQEQILLGPFDYLENLPGKNMRSQFIQAFNQWLQVPTESLEVVEKVTKMLHTASLLVDDIEDNSDLRRGNPVAHRLFGTAQTFNSGNYVYFLALREIQKLQNPQAIDIYAESLIDLHRGQGMDLFWRDSLVCPTQDEYLDMVANKTGGLFCLAIQLMQAESEVQTDFVPLVRLLGIIFQICDDYLNLKSTAYTHNKGLCEDLTEGKFSFPIIHSIRANPGNRQLINILKQKPHEEDIKRHALACMEMTNTFEYTRQFVNVLKAEALEMIEMFENQGLGVNVGIRKILARMSLDPQ